MENDDGEKQIKELICLQIKSCRNEKERLRLERSMPDRVDMDGDGLIREIKFRMERLSKALAVLDTPGHALRYTLIDEDHWLKTEMKEVKEELRALKLSRQFEESQARLFQTLFSSTLIDENRWLKMELKKVKEQFRALKHSRQIGERPRTGLTDLKSVKEYLSDLLAGEKELKVDEVEQRRCCPDLIEKNRWLLGVLEFLLEELRSMKEMEPKPKRTDVKKWRRRYKKYERKVRMLKEEVALLEEKINDPGFPEVTSRLRIEMFAKGLPTDSDSDQNEDNYSSDQEEDGTEEIDWEGLCQGLKETIMYLQEEVNLFRRELDRKNILIEDHAGRKQHLKLFRFVFWN